MYKISLAKSAAARQSLGCNKIYFSSDGWTIGRFGRILRTTNEGTSWIKQTSLATAGLCGFDFIDENLGTVVCNVGIFLRIK